MSITSMVPPSCAAAGPSHALQPGQAVTRCRGRGRPRATFPLPVHRPDEIDPAVTGRPLRVVIDSESSDLQRLTELEFEGQDVEFIQAVYMQSVALIESGQADAAVWDLDETTRRLPPHVTSRPLSPHVRDVIGDTETRVSFVTRADDPATQIIVEKCLDPDRIVDIQQKVLAGEMVPGY